MAAIVDMATIVIDNAAWSANSGVFNANPGDVFIIDPDLTLSPVINGSGDFDVNFDESNPYAIIVSTGADTDPTFNWADNVSTQYITVNANSSDSADFNVGSGTTTYDFQGSLFGPSNYVFGNDTTVNANIWGGNASDSLVTGTNFNLTIGSVIFGRETDLNGQGDTINIGDNSFVYSHVQTGYGSDDITIGNGFSSNGHLISYDSNSTDPGAGDNIVIGDNVSIAGNIWMLGVAPGTDLDTVAGDANGTVNSLVIGDNYTSSLGGIVGPFGQVDITVGENWDIAGVIYTYYGEDTVTLGSSSDAILQYLGQAGNDVLNMSNFDSSAWILYHGGLQETGPYDVLNLTDLTESQLAAWESTLAAAGYTETSHNTWTSNNPDAFESFYFENALFQEWETVSLAVCFARGTMIETDKGEVAIEDLQMGDMVRTADHGAQPIRWIGSSRREAVDKLTPILIRKGALGNTRDLIVSPQHRMLISGQQAELLFGDSEVLVSAKSLVNDHSIISLKEGGHVEYFHMLFDTHEVIFAEGAASESFHPGEEGWKALDEATRDEILGLFPELSEGRFTSFGPTARQSLKHNEGVLLSQYIK